MSNETVDIGGQTLKELDDQGSRLTRIEEGKLLWKIIFSRCKLKSKLLELDNIYKSLGDAEEYLDDLKRLFGKCLVPCTSTRSDIKYDIETAENGGGKSAEKPKKTKTKMNKKAKAEERDEYLNNLNLIRNNVSTLKNMVLEMDKECESKFESIRSLNRNSI